MYNDFIDRGREVFMAAADGLEQPSVPGFLDFEIDIEVKDAQNQEYTVAVLRSPSGEAREVMKFPFSAAELESRLKDIQIALLRSSGERRLALSAEAKVVQEFGRLLFAALMTGEVRNCYAQSQILARNDDKGLRVKLRINPPDLAALPWEFLYDARQAEYVCLSRNTPLVRYVDVPMPIQPILSQLPLHILGMVANPADQIPLKVAAEKKRVQEALAPLIDRGLVELTWLEGGTWQDLYTAMSTGKWHVFHFIGHGGYDRVRDEGTILLEDPSGGTDFMSATQLARLLADHPTMRLVVMNSCEGARGGKEDIFSSTASILVRRGIPAVLAMQYEISDRAAIAFSTHFYKALAEGAPVDAAVSGARISMSLLMDDTLEWATPVLYMRSPDGVLFHIDPGARPISPPKRAVPVSETRIQARPEEAADQLQKRLAAARQKPAGIAQPPGSPPRQGPPNAPAGRPASGLAGNKIVWLGAGGLLVLVVCVCGLLGLLKLFPSPVASAPTLPFNASPVHTLTPALEITPPPVGAVTWTPPPAPEAFSSAAAVVKSYWDFYSDRRFDSAWGLLSNGFRDRTYQGNFETYKADQKTEYCDVLVTAPRLLTETREMLYILATVNFKTSGACKDAPVMLVHQMKLSNATWQIDRVLGGVTADTKCSGAVRRLASGIQAQVMTRSEPLLLRAYPAASEKQYSLESLAPNTTVSVLDGPLCAKYATAYSWWWQVRSPGGVTGWVVEGADETDPIFIAPVP
jgi:hypothetical protein